MATGTPLVKPREPQSRTPHLIVIAATIFLIFSSGIVEAEPQGAASASYQSSILAQARPSDRVQKTVADRPPVELSGNIHARTRTALDLGEVLGSEPTGRLTLTLRRSASQEHALQMFLNAVTTPGTPDYHHWLTPQGFGTYFGVSESDLQAVEQWLSSKGLHVEGVPPARDRILFSGSFGDLEAATHTSIHLFADSGELHMANVRNPEVPAALAAVVAGIGPLHDWRPKPLHSSHLRGAWNMARQRIEPALTLSDTSGQEYLFLDPADAATLYDTPTILNPNSSASYSGAGVTVGLVGYSDLELQDILNYRTGFLGDPSTADLPTVITDGGVDPGVLPGSEAIEALLDNEIAAGLAPGAAIDYYTAASTGLSDGLALSSLRAIQDNAVSVLSVSYGSCEANLGVAGNAFWSELWEQAAAQGITVLVASGDSGAADCDNPFDEQSASNGLTVNGLASTPYDLAVGGTDLPILASDFSGYVSSSIEGQGYRTVLSYIPEAVWNDSLQGAVDIASSSPATDSSGDTNIVATGGGASTSAYCSSPIANGYVCTSALSGYPKPSFQSQATPNDGVRDIPDVSIFSGDAKYSAVWALCSDSVSNGDTGTYTDCGITNGLFSSGTQFEGIGGTSTSAPAMAGILAVITEMRRTADLDPTERFGQVADILYNLAVHHPADFHDVIAGNNSVVCDAGSPGCLSGSNLLSGNNASPGYDLASGIGSVDATLLGNDWANAAFASTTTSLAVGISSATAGTGPINVPHGTPLFFRVEVASGGPPATGQISITNGSASPEPRSTVSDDLTLSSANSGIATATVSDLPGGSYSIDAYYGGDVDHTGSESNKLSVSISPENSATAVTLYSVSPSAQVPALTGDSLTFGYTNYAIVRPGGASGPDGIATGTVQLSSGTNPPATGTLNSDGEVIFPLTSYSPGTYSLLASYSGDASFNASQTTTSFVILKGPTSLALSPSDTTTSASGTVSISIAVNTDSSNQAPTGSVALSGNGQTYAVAQLLPNVSSTSPTIGGRATISFSASSLPVGANTVLVTYSGDANYSGASATALITVPVPASPDFSIAAPNITVANSGDSASSTLTVSPLNGFTGVVNLSCTVSGGESAVLPTCSVPSTSTVGSVPTTVAIVVQTTAPGSVTEELAPFRLKQRLPLSITAAGVLLLIPTPSRRRRRRVWPIVALGLLSAALMVVGCGGSVTKAPVSGGTGSGMYTLTVTGTSGSTTHTASLTVNVE